MSVFAYTALSKEGKRTTGTLSADSRGSALAQIGRQGLSPIKIEEAKDAASAAKQAAAEGAPEPRVSQKAIEAFTRELANLLAGGVSLARALALLKREASNPNAKQLWTDIHEDVTGGTALGDCLAKHPKAFSTVYVAMVRAGEAGGFLDVVLGQIADFRAREQELMGKVKAAMVYPIILGVLAIGVLIFLMTFFIPQFQGIFNQFGSGLPALTVFIVGASNVVKNYGIIVAVVIFVSAVGIKRYSVTESGRRRIEVALLSTPMLGKVIAHFALVRFARMLGTLVGAGVPLISALRVSREAIGNATLADTVSHGIEQVQRGEPLSRALASSPRLFPASVVEMIAVAEETGRLDKELLRLATSYESDLDRQLRLLVSIAEPLMLFAMAGLIGTVVVGMLLPVFNLQDLIK